jgi:mannose/cellobiose epimerase-like protein (N-acyl-D-glucosamine 2-epimerase family)
MVNWLIIRDWLTTHSLPLWANAGFDGTRNTFEERLTPQGASIQNIPRRLMVQARQIYSYATAEQYGWISGAGDLVARAARSMVDLYHEADGQPGWVMSVTQSGQVADATRDLYGHAFVLLGLASAFQSTREERYLKLADKTLLFIDAHMAYSGGGYLPAIPSAPKLLLTQNPHMHLLEALLALYEAAPDENYKRRAQAIVTLFNDQLFMASSGTLIEYFNPGWEPADIGRGITFEPGHHHEWVWLLKRYSKLLNLPLSQHSDALERMAALHGRSPEGLLWSEVRSDGYVTDPSFRLWPHTEAIKAALSRGDMDGANEWLGILYDSFLKDAHPGGWNDRRDSKGAILVDYMPASSLYHLVCAFGECERFYKTDDFVVA